MNLGCANRVSAWTVLLVVCKLLSHVPVFETSSPEQQYWEVGLLRDESALRALSLWMDSYYYCVSGLAIKMSSASLFSLAFCQSEQHTSCDSRCGHPSFWNWESNIYIYLCERQNDKERGKWHREKYLPFIHWFCLQMAATAEASQVNAGSQKTPSGCPCCCRGARTQTDVSWGMPALTVVP